LLLDPVADKLRKAKDGQKKGGQLTGDKKRGKVKNLTWNMRGLWIVRETIPKMPTLV
jgi:hypothetical protein